jgi:putative sterol carrier protein
VATAFSDAWARAWCVALNDSEAYRQAASSWEGSVALLVTDRAGQPLGAVWLDLHRGTCRAARAASTDDLETAAYVIEAEPSIWRDVLHRRVSPVQALMTGRLRLARGELGALLPHASSAQQLLRLAEQLDTEFPEAWLDGGLEQGVGGRE